MTDSRARFSGRVTDYARYRPNYPESIILAVVDGCVSPAIADLGSGTGIAAELLAPYASIVYAVEPNAGMRARLPKRAGIVAVDGTAEATGLAGASIDVACAFQAYHWFDPARVMREVSRIAKSRARFAAVWNHRDRGDPFTGAYEAIVDRYDTSGGSIDRDRRSETVRADLAGAGWRDIHLVEAAHEQALDWESLIGFVRSTSYLPREGDAYERMCRDFRAFFAGIPQQSCRFRWVTRAILGDRGS